MRYFAIGMNEYNVVMDIAILIIFSIFMILLGGYLFRKS